MKKACLIFLFLCTWVQSVHSQKFEKGYIIQASGDTLRGEIFLEMKTGSVRSVQFKNGGAMRKIINPFELKGLGTQEVSYLTKVVTIDKSPKKPQLFIDTLFLEILVRGSISLLFYADEFDKSHFYVEQGNGSVEELGLKFLDLGDGIHFQKLEPYKDNLKKYFPKCPQWYAEIDKTPYERNRIQKLFIKCYQCNFGKEPLKEGKTEATTVNLGVIGCAFSSQLKFEDNVNSGYRAPLYTFDKSVGPMGGIFIDLTFPRINKLFVLRNELLYRKITTASPEIVESSLIQKYVKSSGYISASYIKYNLILRQKLSYGKVAPFINVGFAASILLSHTDYATVSTSTFGAPPVITQEPLLGKVSSFEAGFLAGAGVLMSNFGFELRWEGSNGLQPQYSQTSPVTSLYLLASYMF